MGNGLVGHLEDADLALLRQGESVVDEGVVAGLERCELDEAALGAPRVRTWPQPPPDPPPRIV